MRSLFVLILSFMVVATLTGGCGGAAPSSTGAAVARPAQLDTAATQMTEGGRYQIRYTSGAEPVPISKLHAWTLHVETPDGQPVTGATVAVDGGMPEHNHGLPTRPQVTEMGAGDYRVEGLKFQMPGWWTVTVSVVAGGQEDSATFNLLLN